MNDYPLLSDPRRGCAPGKADPEVFFGKADSKDYFGDREMRDNDHGPTSYTEAIKICTRRCPSDIRAECDRYATETKPTHGVWAGKIYTPKSHHARPAPPPDPEPDRTAERQQRRDALDAEVARLHARGVADVIIAIGLGVDPKAVGASRRRQNLPTLHGPGGRRRREQVSA